ncbi:MAG TPA: DUF167 domain-containing protein, partial [Gaiellaceae bacterium]|nr:DUF167 domain-containing protein [Gaiellaceae bacterium]
CLTRTGTYTGCEMAVATTRLSVRVTPGTGQSRIVGRHGDAWKVRIGVAPERGRANAALCELLAKSLRVRPADVSVVSGHTARDKIVELRGVSPSEVAARLEPTGA